jgi:type II secretory pathway component PulF
MRKHRGVFFRCLATLFESGVSLVQSFELLAEQSEAPALSEAARAVSRGLQHGHTLSACLAQHPGCFTPQHLNLVRVGERSGALSHVFERLALDEERGLALVERMRAALLLPLLITGLCIGLICLVAPLLLGSVLNEMGLDFAQLPWMTKVLVGASALLRSPWSWLAAVLLLLGGGRAWRRRSARSRLIWARLLDRVPGLGSTWRLYATLRFVRTLETTVSVGVPLVECLEMAGRAAAHPLLQQAMPGLLAAVRQGDELDLALENCDFFTASVVQSVRAGQEAGSLVVSLHSLARLQEIDLTHSCELFTQMLEPLVLLIVGGLVGFCVVATILPVSQLVEQL